MLAPLLTCPVPESVDLFLEEHISHTGLGYSLVTLHKLIFKVRVTKYSRVLKDLNLGFKHEFLGYSLACNKLFALKISTVNKRPYYRECEYGL